MCGIDTIRSRVADGRQPFREDEGMNRIYIWRLRMATRERLCGRLHEPDIVETALEAEMSAHDSLREELYQLMFDADARVSENAAWIFSHFGKKGNLWLQDRQDALIHEVMGARSATKRRLILSILRKQHFEKETINTAFLDYCLEQILSPGQPVGIRSLCIYLAYEQCVYYLKLLAELETTLRQLSRESLTPGLRHAQRQTLGKIRLA